MSTFTQNKSARTPFGRNAFLRSTKDVKTDSYTFAKDGIPANTIDGNTQKVLQPGTVIAKITVGPDAGKVGVFQANGVVEVQTITEATNITAGVYKISLGNMPAVTANITHTATAAVVQAAVRAALAASTDAADVLLADSITVTGGPVGTTALTVTYEDAEGANWPALTVDVSGLTGTVTVATGVAGVAGATDGRGSTANIVGIVDTFLPWQLLERDVEVAVVYEATVVQAWCFEYDGSGARIALGNTTRDAMIALAATKNISYK